MSGPLFHRGGMHGAYSDGTSCAVTTVSSSTARSATAPCAALAGYEMAMRAAGLTPREVDGDFRLEGGDAAVAELLETSRRPSALVVANNLMTPGALRAIRAAGLRVPADIALVAVDDPPWAELVDPPLTTLAQPVRRMAADAMELLLQRVSGERERPRRIVHPFELRRRASAGG